MKKKALALILALLLCVGLLPAAAFAATTEVGTWQELNAALQSSGEVKLKQNIKAGSGDSYLSVRTGKTVTLDLNGFTIDRGLTNAAAKDKGYVMSLSSNANLTIKDSSPDQTGKITGGNSSGNGGGILMTAYDAKLTLTGGSICGNTGKFGAGVYMNASGVSFTMTGGSIEGNHATNNGIVGLYSISSFTMTGGSITGNIADGACSGVYLLNSGTSFTMTGGSITNNVSKGGGTHAAAVVRNSEKNQTAERMATVTVSGKVNISGNTNAEGESNVRLTDDQYLQIDKAGLHPDSRIGVSTTKTPPGNIIRGSAPGAGSVFSYDNGTCDISIDDSGNVVVTEAYEVGNWSALHAALQSHTSIKLTDDAVWQSGDPAPLTVPAGKTVTLDLNGKKIDRALTGKTEKGYVFDVLGDLTVKDSSADQTGVITGGWNSGYTGGGLFIEKKAVFTLAGGSITGNRSNRGGALTAEDGSTVNLTGGKITGNEASDVSGGLHIYTATVNLSGSEISNNVSGNNGGGVNLAITGGVLNMTGGKITGNKAKSKGAGVFVASNSTFNMSGGEISGNEGASWGGGVGLDNGTFNMTGGRITGNIAQTGAGVSGSNYQVTLNIFGGEITGNKLDRQSGTGGGVYVDGTFHLSGAVTIADNVNPYTEGSDNVYLESKRTIMVDGKLTPAQPIGVRMNTAGVFTSGFAGTNPGVAPETVFASDAEYFDVAATEAGEGTLAVQPHAHDGVTCDKPWFDRSQLPTESGHYFLTKNVSVETWTVPAKAEIHLCLNGYKIQGISDSEVPTIIVGGSSGSATSILHIYDDTGRGEITHGHNDRFSSMRKGPGVLVNGGRFYLHGGKITNNVTTGNGGGIRMESQGYAYLLGGEVSGNSASGQGGGIWAEYHDSTYGDRTGIVVGLNACVKDNVIGGKIDWTTGKGSGGTANNIYLQKDQSIGFYGFDGEDGLTENAIMGVTLETPHEFTSGLSNDGTIDNFFSDSSDYIVVESDRKEAMLIPGQAPLTVVKETLDGDQPWAVEPQIKVAGVYTVPEIEGFRVLTYTKELTDDPYSEGSTTTSEGATIILSEEPTYLYYARQQYTLAYYDDPQCSAPISTSLRFEEPIPWTKWLPTATNYRDGYYLAGWTTEKKESGQQIYSHKEARKVDYFDAETMPSDHVTLYPVFVKDRLRVHLDLGAYDAVAAAAGYDWYNDRGYVSGDADATMYEAQAREFTVNIDEKIRMLYVDDDGNIAPDNGMLFATRPGYELDGWYTQSGLLWNGEDWKNATTEDKWVPMTAEYCDKDEDGKPIRIVNDKDRYYYNVVTLTAHWTLKDADIVLDPGEGANYSGKRNISVKPGAAATIPTATPVLDDSVFLGWQSKTGNIYLPDSSLHYTDTSEVTRCWGEGQNVNEIKLTAKYLGTSDYVILFDTQIGTVITQDVYVVEGDMNVTVTNPYLSVPAGLVFRGWYSDPTYTTQVFPETAEPGASKELPLSLADGRVIHFYAKWDSLTFTITYQSDGKVIETSDPIAYKTVIPDVVKNRQPPEGTKPYYDFKGWAGMPDIMPAMDFPVSAKWEPKTYDVYFVDADTTVDSFKAAFGALITAPEMPDQKTEAGTRIFAGWKLGETVLKVPPEKITEALAKEARDGKITLTATWTLKPAAPKALTEADVEKTATSITVKAPVAGQEYSIDGGKTWKTAEAGKLIAFSPLTPNKQYEVITRIAATDTAPASEPSEPLAVTTDKLPADEPPKPEAAAASSTSVEVSPAYTGVQYVILKADEALTDAAWDNAKTAEGGKVVFSGLTPNTAYIVYARTPETEVQKASGAVASDAVRTPANEPAPTPAPSGGQETTYRITVQTAAGGTVKSDRATAPKGAAVTLTVVPAEGGKLVSLTVKDANGQTVSLTDKGNDVWTFQMPASDVTVSAVFQAAAPAGRITEFISDFTECGADDQCPLARFDDLDPDAWYHDGVHFVLRNGIMSGNADGTFAPDRVTTRAELLQILFNLEGKPAVEQTLSYTDVDADAWYVPALKWATANGLVNGNADGTFAPNAPVTREQMAKILFYYAQLRGIPTLAAVDLSRYPDAAEISDWAVSYMQWAVGAQLINGRAENGVTLLAPGAGAKRSEVATLMMRFCLNLLSK